MNSKIARRRERAANRLMNSIINKRHDWKSADGKDKARECLNNLSRKGVAGIASSLVDESKEVLLQESFDNDLMQLAGNYDEF